MVLVLIFNWSIVMFFWLAFFTDVSTMVFVHFKTASLGQTPFISYLLSLLEYGEMAGKLPETTQLKIFFSSLLPKIQTASHKHGFSVWFPESVLINGKYDIYISKQSLAKRKNLSPLVLSKIHCCLVLLPLLCIISSSIILCNCFLSCRF